MPSAVRSASLSLLALGLACGVSPRTWAQTTGGGTNNPPSTTPPAAPPVLPTVPTTTPGIPITPTTSPTSPLPKPNDNKDPQAKEGENSDVPLKEEKPIAERFLGKWGRGINISGRFSTMFQRNSVTGSANASQLFNEQVATNNLEYRSSGPLQQAVDVTVSGRVFNAFDVDARLTNSRFGNQFNQIFRFNYHTRDNKTKVDLGNIPANLQGNELVNFSRQLQGLMFSRDFADGKIMMQGIASFTRGVTRRGTFRGQGISGPYFINASMIIEGSEKVRLNGQELATGTDYRVDYVNGTISFQNGRIINPEDTIEYTYEAQNFNTTPGLLSGMRWNFTDPKGNDYGITYLQQNATGQRTRNGDITERLPVFADPNYRYPLGNLIDSSRPVVIKWNNRVLIEGVDYYLNKDLRFFRLLNSSLPPDTSLTGIASLQVTYRPIRQNSLSGNRNVLGIDTLMKLASNGSVGIQFGQSDGDGTGPAGLAMKITTNWQSPGSGDRNRWKFSLGYNDVDANFSTIDSTSGAFLQAQRGLQANFSFSPRKYVDFTTSLNQGQVANRDTTTSTTTGAAASNLIWASNTGANFGLNLNFPNAPTVRLSHQTTTQNSGGAGNRSLFANTALDLAYSFTKTLRTTAGFGRTTSEGRSIFASAFNNSVLTSTSVTGTTIIDQIQDASGSNSVTNSSSDYARFGAEFTPFSFLSMNGNLGFSRSASGSSTSTSTNSSGNSARTMALGIILQPLRGMNMTFNYTEGSNGRSTSNYYDPSGGNNNSIIPTSTDGQKTRTTDFTMQYAPLPYLSFNYSGRRDLSLVPGYDNTTSISNTYGLNIRPEKWMDISLSMTGQNLQYVGGQGDSNNNTMSLQAVIGPLRRTTFTAGLTRTNFDSATYYASSGGSGIGFSSGSNGFGNRTGGNGLLQQGVNTTYAVQMEYDIFRKRMIQFTWQSLDQFTPQGTNGSGTSSNAATRSQTNFRQGIATVGFSLPLDKITNFQINYNLTNLTDRDNSRFSYRANTFTANLVSSF